MLGSPPGIAAHSGHIWNEKENSKVRAASEIERLGAQKPYQLPHLQNKL